MSDQPARPPLPPPVVALIAQARALQSQVDALVLGLESLGYGMAASAARQQQQTDRTSRDPNAMGPVFGAQTSSPLPDPTAALARLETPTSD